MYYENVFALNVGAKTSKDLWMAITVCRENSPLKTS